MYNIILVLDVAVKMSASNVYCVMIEVCHRTWLVGQNTELCTWINNEKENILYNGNISVENVAKASSTCFLMMIKSIRFEHFEYRALLCSRHLKNQHFKHFQNDIEQKSISCRKPAVEHNDDKTWQTFKHNLNSWTWHFSMIVI